MNGIEISKSNIDISRKITNGEVIRSLFPDLLEDDAEDNIGYLHTNEKSTFERTNVKMTFRKEWWDAPYNGDKL